MPLQTDYQRLSLLGDMGSVTRSQSDTSYEGLASLLRDKRGRRCSEWVSKEDKKVVLRPLQLNNESGSLLHRRLSRYTAKERVSKSQEVVHKSQEGVSKVREGVSKSEEGVYRPNEAESRVTKEGVSRTKESVSTRRGVSRSQSVRCMKKSAEGRLRGSSIPNDRHTNTGVAVKERTVSNRSLPLPGDETVRNFCVTSKGIVNRGDSFRVRSSPVAEHREPPKKEAGPMRKPYRVVLAGAPGVGKRSMWKQFMTSEYILAGDYPTDTEYDNIITVVLNNEESQMEFEVETLQEENAYVYRSEEPDAYVIVYSVIDRRSFSQARRLLAYLQKHTNLDAKAVILVANKTDLARLRQVSMDEGKSLAKERNCKFIETSVAINHQLDELLAGTLAQIRIRANRKSHRKSSSSSSHSKASGVLKKILRRACIKSKSCDNLHVL